MYIYIYIIISLFGEKISIDANNSLLYIHAMYETERKYRHNIYRLNPNYDLGTLCLNMCK